MKTRFVKIALIAAAAMTMVFGATMVANAEEYFAKPRVASACNNVNCKGHVSVYNGASDLNIYVCVPESWGKSLDEYRTAAENFYVAESGVAVPATIEVEQPSKCFTGAADVTAAPVDEQDLVAYVAEHRSANTCKNVDCKGHVYVKNPATGLDSPYCVPESWVTSVDEFRAKLQEYMNLKFAPAPKAPVAPAAPSAAVYVVKKGDTLSKIAKACYGDSKLWKAIYEANKASIKNPNVISVGQVICLPAAPVVPVAPAVDCAPVVVPSPVAPIVAPSCAVTPVEKDAMTILNAKVQQAIDVHNAVVDAVDNGVISLTKGSLDYLDNGADALNVIETLKAKDYTNLTALQMYNQMDAYIITVTKCLK